MNCTVLKAGTYKHKKAVPKKCEFFGTALLYHKKLLSLYTCKLRVDHDATAILANDNFLVHLDVELTLRRYTVETTTTCIALDINDSQTIACIFANALECLQETRLDEIFEIFYSFT